MKRVNNLCPQPSRNETLFPSEEKDADPNKKRLQQLKERARYREVGEKEELNNGGRRIEFPISPP